MEKDWKGTEVRCWDSGTDTLEAEIIKAKKNRIPREDCRLGPRGSRRIRGQSRVPQKDNGLAGTISCTTPASQKRVFSPSPGQTKHPNKWVN